MGTFGRSGSLASRHSATFRPNGLEDRPQPWPSARGKTRPLSYALCDLRRAAGAIEISGRVFDPKTAQSRKIAPGIWLIDGDEGTSRATSLGERGGIVRRHRDGHRGDDREETRDAERWSRPTNHALDRSSTGPDLSSEDRPKLDRQGRRGRRHGFGFMQRRSGGTPSGPIFPSSASSMTSQ